jgi:predicted nucleic acid-binding protein
LGWAIRASRFTILYDSCVLYPAPLRDLLMQLALTDLFRAKWTNVIHDEWITSLLRNRPDLTQERLRRTRDLMNECVRDCIVEGFEPLIEALSLPDPDDRHVLAAAIRCKADLILTYNLEDFPAKSLDRWNIEAQHPDEFIVHLLGLDEALVCEAVRACRERLDSPPKSVDEYLDTLAAQRLPETVSWLRQSVARFS